MPDISRENEKFIDEIVGAGQFKNRREAMDQAIRLLRCELQQNGRKSAPALSAQEWCDRFESWASAHPALPFEADDSRDAIYSERGQ